MHIRSVIPFPSQLRGHYKNKRGELTKQGIRGAGIHIIRQNIANNQQDLYNLYSGLRDIIHHPQALI